MPLLRQAGEFLFLWVKPCVNPVFKVGRTRYFNLFLFLSKHDAKTWGRQTEKRQLFICCQQKTTGKWLICPELHVFSSSSIYQLQNNESWIFRVFTVARGTTETTVTLGWNVLAHGGFPSCCSGNHCQHERQVILWEMTDHVAQAPVRPAATSPGGSSWPLGTHANQQKNHPDELDSKYRPTGSGHK